MHFCPWWEFVYLDSLSQRLIYDIGLVIIMLPFLKQ